jgi:NADPH-dependent 2,4-dienoyl-CoA reductase/sulfur reductase-like enzyme
MRLLVIGGSDAGIAAGLRARELDPSVEATVVVADAFPNFSICGLPYYLTVDRLSDLDLSYTPPFGSPWDAVQLAAQDWV